MPCLSTRIIGEWNDTNPGLVSQETVQCERVLNHPGARHYGTLGDGTRISWEGAPSSGISDQAEHHHNQRSTYL